MLHLQRSKRRRHRRIQILPGLVVLPGSAIKRQETRSHKRAGRHDESTTAMAHAIGKGNQTSGDQDVRQGSDPVGQGWEKDRLAKEEAACGFPELKKALAKNARTRKGFANLRPGLQREYTDHEVSAKRDETKTKRIEKILPMIAAGIGLNDIYR